MRYPLRSYILNVTQSGYSAPKETIQSVYNKERKDIFNQKQQNRGQKLQN